MSRCKCQVLLTIMQQCKSPTHGAKATMSVLRPHACFVMWLHDTIVACSTIYSPGLLQHCNHCTAVCRPCAAVSVTPDHRVAHKLLTAGMGVARWTKALGDLQGLGCSLSRSNMEALFRSAVHAPVRIVSSALHCIHLKQVASAC